jgi:hypothetical protein
MSADTPAIQAWYLPGTYTVAVLKHGRWRPVEVHGYGNDAEAAHMRLRKAGASVRTTYVWDGRG